MLFPGILMDFSHQMFWSQRILLVYQSKCRVLGIQDQMVLNRFQLHHCLFYLPCHYWKNPVSTFH